MRWQIYFVTFLTIFNSHLVSPQQTLAAVPVGDSDSGKMLPVIIRLSMQPLFVCSTDTFIVKRPEMSTGDWYYFHFN